MHRRDLLTVKQLEEFAAFCERNGWTRHPVKGEHEALRMKSPRGWLLVHKRDHTLAGSTSVVHLSVWGVSLEMATRFFKEKKSQIRGQHAAVYEGEQ